MGRGSEGREAEDAEERLDRELIELLNELRVALPGVQVLFAFLLTVPFTQRFPELSPAQRDVYFASFLATGVASVLLMAPTAYHRIRWRQYDKERMLRTANRLAIGGMLGLASAIAATVFLITDLLFRAAVGAAIAAAMAGLLAWLWFGLPLSRRIRDRDGGSDDPSADRGAPGPR
ncbi:MAG TPA: DUF6328 family protein [Actinomycetota bacterium]|nr:DUF6328 family protein [Actinomycetota bacterium]